MYTRTTTSLLSLGTLLFTSPITHAAPGSSPNTPQALTARALPTTTVSNLPIFSPPSDAGWTDPRVLYARALHLSLTNSPATPGALLAVWENYSPEPPAVYFPVHRSLDGGSTWSPFSTVPDTAQGWGNRYQPTLYQLPSPLGRFPAGTVLLAGNAIPTDLSATKIDIYASLNAGLDWEFVTSVATGGEARPWNGLTPVWEPHLYLHNDTLICYFADQRDPDYGQKLAHRTTTDLETWSELVDDVHDDASYEARPGMPGITLLPDGNFIFVYEVCGTDGCRVHYRLGPDPLDILSAPFYSLVTDRGTRPVSSPNVVWSSMGGEAGNGAIVVSSGSQGSIFVNRELGDPNSWVEYDTPQPNAYSRGLMLFEEDDTKLMIIGAGWLPPSDSNQVSASVVDLVEMGV